MNIIREGAGSICRISKGKRYIWITRIVVACTCFVAVLASPPTSYASDPITLDTKLGNGRPLKDLRDIIGAGLGLRTDALSKSSEEQRIMLHLATKLGIEMPQKSLVGLLGFFMRGAIPFPMMTKSGSYVVFVNPVADSVLLTSWSIADGKIVLENARLVVGEILEGTEVSALTARWTNTDAMADTLQEIVQVARNLTSNPSPADIKRVEDIFKDSQKKHVLPIRRITAAALGTSGKNVPCVNKLLNLGTDVRTLSLSAETTNISPQTIASELIPTGGLNLGDITILVYAFVEQPGSFVFAGADQTKDCSLFSLNGVQTINY